MMQKIRKSLRAEVLEGGEVARAASSASPELSRRQVLSLLGASAAMSACGSDDGASASPALLAEPMPWATGGTAGLAAEYPDPFAGGAGGLCNLTCRSTIGPCYASTIERRDISEGNPGLPVRLSLRVVDADCNPIADAEVDIWHTRNTGAYSADDTGLGLVLPTPPAGAAMPAAAMPPAAMPGAPGGGAPLLDCSAGDEAARQARFFRGWQRTSADGRVDFDTCYPGAYTGRALHIHFTIRRGGEAWVTSQLYYPEELTSSIYAQHPDYAPFGPPDTVNSTDGIFGGPEEVLEIAQQPDGVILASKTLVLRRALTDELCGVDVLAAPLPT